VSRRFRLLTILLSLWAMLVSTGAMAGYACPGAGSGAELAQVSEAAASQAETVASQVDDEQTGICHGHCQSEQKSAEPFNPPSFPTLDQFSAALIVAPLIAPSPPAAGVLVSQLRRETAPPLSVRHCCFRL
jgi:hypothetical protein